MALADTQVPRDPTLESTAALPLAVAPEVGREPAALPELPPGRYLARDDEHGGCIVLELGGESMRVGRSPAADLVVDDASVSRRHAVFVRRDERTVILDDRSRNGIVVNGARVQEAALDDGDRIALGNVTLRYVEVGA